MRKMLIRRLKNGLALAVIAALAVALAGPEAQAQNPGRKLGRGLANIATGWVEIPLEITQTTFEKGDIAGIFVAPFVGTFKALRRTLAGVYETATFFVPFPADFAPIVDPEFVMEED